MPQWFVQLCRISKSGKLSVPPCSIQGLRQPNFAIGEQWDTMSLGQIPSLKRLDEPLCQRYISRAGWRLGKTLGRAAPERESENGSAGTELAKASFVRQPSRVVRAGSSIYPHLRHF